MYLYSLTRHAAGVDAAAVVVNAAVVVDAGSARGRGRCYGCRGCRC